MSCIHDVTIFLLIELVAILLNKNEWWSKRERWEKRKRKFSLVLHPKVILVFFQPNPPRFPLPKVSLIDMKHDKIRKSYFLQKMSYFSKKCSHNFERVVQNVKIIKKKISRIWIGECSTKYVTITCLLPFEQSFLS